MAHLLEKLSPDEALVILRQLAKGDVKLKEKILEIATNLIQQVDVDQVCDEVFSALDGIDVHELWNRSGASYDGYNSPDEMAFEMVEEILDPFNLEVFRLMDLNMNKESMQYCMGVLKGFYRYDQESHSEFKEWAVDVPGECFHDLLEQWQKRIHNNNEIIEMDQFMKTECIKWAE